MFSFVSPGEKRVVKAGIEAPRSRINRTYLVELDGVNAVSWTQMVGVGKLVVPLVNLLREERLERPYMLMDETTATARHRPE